MTQDTRPPAERESTLTCPKCKSAMEKVVFAGITVDRCLQCRGLWFDALEREHLAAIKRSESIDLGPARPGPEHAKATISCPVCHTPMIRMTDPRHHGLWFESCTVCYGVFFDAGEFREYKEHSILETFRGWLHGKRE